MKKLSWVLVLFFVFSFSPAAGKNETKLVFDREVEQVVVDCINQSQSSIYIEMYDFTDYTPVTTALMEAAKRGICVALYVDNTGQSKPEYDETGACIHGCPERQLETAGVEVRWESKHRKMHRKLAIFDEKTLFLGSTNWSDGGFKTNNEVDVLLPDPELAKQAVEQFMRDWSEASPEY